MEPLRCQQRHTGPQATAWSTQHQRTGTPRSQQRTATASRPKGCSMTQTAPLHGPTTQPVKARRSIAGAHRRQHGETSPANGATTQPATTHRSTGCSMMKTGQRTCPPRSQQRLAGPQTAAISHGPITQPATARRSTKDTTIGWTSPVNGPTTQPATASRPTNGSCSMVRQDPSNGSTTQPATARRPIEGSVVQTAPRSQ